MEITTTIDKQSAERLIGLAAGRRHPRGGYVINGAHYWQTDEALMVALQNIADANGVALE
jgi:hypothetical protein